MENSKSFNPFACRPYAQYAPQSRTFKRPGEDGTDQDFTLTFAAMSEPQRGIAQDKFNALVARYLGDPDNDIEPEMEFPPVNGGCVEISRSLLHNASVFETMQPSGSVERFSALDFIARSAVLKPSVWQSLIGFNNEVTAAALKNEMGESGTKTSSVSRSTKPGNTPK